MSYFQLIYIRLVLQVCTKQCTSIGNFSPILSKRVSSLHEGDDVYLFGKSLALAQKHTDLD